MKAARCIRRDFGIGDSQNLGFTWGDPVNRTAVSTRIGTLVCPSSPADPARLDGIPEVQSYSASWTPTVAAVTDYSPLVGIDARLSLYGLFPAGSTPPRSRSTRCTTRRCAMSRRGYA